MGEEVSNSVAPYARMCEDSRVHESDTTRGEQTVTHHLGRTNCAIAAVAEIL